MKHNVRFSWLPCLQVVIVQGTVIDSPDPTPHEDRPCHHHLGRWSWYQASCAFGWVPRPQVVIVQGMVIDSPALTPHEDRPCHHREEN